MMSKLAVKIEPVRLKKEVEAVAMADRSWNASDDCYLETGLI